MDYPHLATRFFNVPIAITPDKAEIVMAALADRFGVARLFRSGELVILADGGAATDIGAGDEFGRAAPAPERFYDLVAGVAIIPVCGTLVQKSGSMRPFSGMTGYNAIRLNFMTALNDPEAKAIMLDIDSPGGECSGLFDLCDTIRAGRGEKPIWAVLNESAYSAAYALASAADKITVPRTGGTGSVGVIYMHVDFSQSLSKAGIAVTMLQYGARKSDGNEFEPLSKPARTRFQADIDAMGELFVDTVARNRGIAATKVRDTEALTYLGAAGVAIGFADAVMSPDAAFRALHKSLT